MDTSISIAFWTNKEISGLLVIGSDCILFHFLVNKAAEIIHLGMESITELLIDGDKYNTYFFTLHS